MDLAPLTTAAPVIRAHAYMALAALCLGGMQLALPKGVLPHRAMGYCWAVLMLTVAVTSFFIHSKPVIGPFGPIHILSLFVCVNVPLAVLAARRRNLRAHRTAMLWIYSLALVVTGLFTLWPGRIMHKVVFE